MAEEQKNWEEANNHTLCVNNCGFFGSPTTLNLCSKCYQNHRLNQQHISTAKISLSLHQSQPPPSSSSTSPSDAIDSVSVNLTVPDVAEKSPERNRCGACRRRVGLTGFRCRCGTTFCGTHRYPEHHGCGFDYQRMGKEAIAKANPVVKGVKLDKI